MRIFADPVERITEANYHPEDQRCLAQDDLSAPPPAHGNGVPEAERGGVAVCLARGDHGRGKALKKSQQESRVSGSRRRCADCGASKSTIWRKGPTGLKTLCNACGIRYSKQVKRSAHQEEFPEDVKAAMTLMIMSKDVSSSSNRQS